MLHYAIGIDFGTNSCRAVVVNLQTGAETATAVYNYQSGDAGVLISPRDPNLARQDPADYIKGLGLILEQVVQLAQKNDQDFSPQKVVGIGTGATGSTPLPVDQQGRALGVLPQFEDNLNAQAWLWKDHTSHAEAARITALAADIRPQYLAKCGGAYSSEWFWAKILSCKLRDPTVFEAAFSFVELSDWIPAVLTGNQNPLQFKRNICAAGHKAMFSNTWGGLPDAEFLEQLDPMLAELRGRLYDEAYTADTVAGGLSAEWAQLSGLPVGTPVAVGALDAHVGAVGAGCAEGRLAKILGTSTCDLMVGKPGQSLPDIPGVAGIVDGSVLPGCFGIEAGQSAVGDIFLWFANNFVPASMGESAGTKLATLDQQADQIKPGQSGLLALDWNNGNRNVLTDPRLSGLILGQTLHTSAAEMYRAIVEATAFGARMIIDRVREYGVPVNEVVTCGGLAVKSPFLMQIYADVLNIPMTVAASDQTCALGAAIFGAVAAGVFPSVEVAQSGLCHIRERIYQPNPVNVAVYSQLYRLYHQVHDAFGLPDGGCALANVMKDLITIRGNQR